MPVRTTTRMVSFTNPFMLKGYDELLMPGCYEVETDEELIEALSFPAYRRIMTLIHLRTAAEDSGVRLTLKIDPEALDAALERDRIAKESDHKCRNS